MIAISDFRLMRLHFNNNDDDADDNYLLIQNENVSIKCNGIIIIITSRLGFMSGMKLDNFRVILRVDRAGTHYIDR